MCLTVLSSTCSGLSLWTETNSPIPTDTPLPGNLQSVWVQTAVVAALSGDTKDKEGGKPRGHD